MLTLALTVGVSDADDATGTAERDAAAADAANATGAAAAAAAAVRQEVGVFSGRNKFAVTGLFNLPAMLCWDHTNNLPTSGRNVYAYYNIRITITLATGPPAPAAPGHSDSAAVLRLLARAAQTAGASIVARARLSPNAGNARTPRRILPALPQGHGQKMSVPE